MNLRGCCLSVNALCCFSHNSSSHILKLTWCCIMLPTYSLRLFPQQQFVCFYFLPLLLPTACICTFTIHNFAKCICCSVSFVCILLKCHYYWGEHAGNFIKYERKYANGKKKYFDVFLSVSECNFENTQMTWVFAMIQCTASFVYYIRKLCMQVYSLQV